MNESLIDSIKKVNISKKVLQSQNKVEQVTIIWLKR